MLGLTSVRRWMGVRRFGYDAVEEKGRRRPPRVRLISEDAELSATDRKKLVATARDLPRNYTIAAWMIRKHLDYVSTFGFQARTANTEYNTRLEKFVGRWATREAFDLAGRHTLHRFIRLQERGRTLDGDSFTLKHTSGRLQAIEGDRIRTPQGGLSASLARDDLVHGVQVDAAGKALAYALCNRNRLGDGFTFDRMVPARHILQHAYFDRFDQTRGVSPMAPGINSLQDTYEGLTYALAKAKVSQLFGIKIKRFADESVGDISGGSDAEGNPVKSEYKVKLGGPPFLLDLDPGDDADFLESKHPSAEFRDFTQLMISISLKCLDIPFSFIDESFTNYSGSRGAWLLYDFAADGKRRDNRQLLSDMTRWRIGLGILDGELDLPRSVGDTVEDVTFEWLNRGIPWIDPLKEIKADAEAVKLGVTSRRRIAKRGGDDWLEILQELDEEEKLLRAMRPPMPGEPEDDNKDDEDENKDDEDEKDDDPRKKKR